MNNFLQCLSTLEHSSDVVMHETALICIHREPQVNSKEVLWANSFQ